MGLSPRKSQPAHSLSLDGTDGTHASIFCNRASEAPMTPEDLQAQLRQVAATVCDSPVRALCSSVRNRASGCLALMLATPPQDPTVVFFSVKEYAHAPGRWLQADCRRLLANRCQSTTKR